MTGPDRDRIRDRRVQYETAGLERSDLADDPMFQWNRWHDDAFEAGLVEPNAMTVSTVDSKGAPDARIVLVRGADDDGFTFFTNYESAKAAQIAANDHVALTFAWLDLHRQVRVRGSIVTLPAAASAAYFDSRPRASQIGAWASPQSSVLDSRDELDRRVARFTADFDGRDVPRPEHWGGYRITPTIWEFWQGRPSRLHDRFRYRANGETWLIDRLAP